MSAFAEKARAMSPLPVIEVLLFGSRARGIAMRASDWDIAIVVHAGNGADSREARMRALEVFSDIALPEIAAGFHLRPIVIPAAKGSPDPDNWRVSPDLARNIRADGVRIALGARF